MKAQEAQNVGEVYAICALEVPDSICITNSDKSSGIKDLGCPDEIFVVIDLLTFIVPWIQATEMQPLYELDPDKLKADYREKAVADAIFNACRPKEEACKPYLSTLSVQMKRNWLLDGLPTHLTAADPELLKLSPVQSFTKVHGIGLLNMQDVALTPEQEESLQVALAQVQLEIQTCLNMKLPKTRAIHTATDAVAIIHAASEWEEQDIKMRYSRADHKVHMTLAAFQKMLMVAAYKTSVFMQLRGGSLPHPFLPSALNCFGDTLEEIKQRWMWNLELCDEFLLRGVVNTALFRISLCPSYKVLVTLAGFEADGQDLFYDCEALEASRFFSLTDHHFIKRAEAARIFIDPDNVSRAWIFPLWEVEPSLFFECKLASWSECFQGLTLVQAQAAHINPLLRKFSFGFY